jgi:predicted transposase YdaD
MPPHDRLFKSLLRAFLPDLLRLVAPGVAARLHLDRVTFLDKELLVGEGRREADLVARVPLRDKGALIIHVEIEARARRTMPQRLRAYALRIQSLYEGQLLTILLNLRGGSPGVQRMRLDGELPDPELSSFQYVAFGLAASLAVDYLKKPEPLAWALAAVMRCGSMGRAEHKLACLHRIAAGRLSRDRELLLVNFVEEYLLLTPQEQEEYKVLSARNTGRKGNAMWMPWSERVQLEARKEGIRLGQEKGLQRGIQKGQAQGERDGMRKLLLHLLAQQFGPLPEAVRSQVEEITSTRRLTSLAGKVLKARSLGDLGFC